MIVQSGIYSLAPSWMSVFEKWDDLKRYQKEAIVLDLEKLNKNPIAESHSWNCSFFNKECNDYCAECSWFGWSYKYVITGDLTLDREIVDLKGAQFTEHYVKEHNGSDLKTPDLRMSTQYSHSPSSSVNGHKRGRLVKLKARPRSS